MSRLEFEAARCEALFVSSLQRSQRPDPEQVRDAVTRTIRTLGVRACGELMAQEFGDHPETAVARMRWVKQAVSKAYPATGHSRHRTLLYEPAPRPNKELAPAELAQAAA